MNKKIKIIFAIIVLLLTVMGCATKPNLVKAVEQNTAAVERFIEFQMEKNDNASALSGTNETDHTGMLPVDELNINVDPSLVAMANKAINDNPSEVIKPKTVQPQQNLNSRHEFKRLQLKVHRMNQTLQAHGSKLYSLEPELKKLGVTEYFVIGNFFSGSDEINSQVNGTTLDYIKNDIIPKGYEIVTVWGHTDNDWSLGNMAISQKRADAILQFISKSNPKLLAEKVDVTGKGPTNDFGANEMGRVVIIGCKKK